MALVEPTTRSPGRLALVYGPGGDPDRHIMSARLVGTDFPTVAALRTEATAFANAAKVCISTAQTIVGWKVIDNDGQSVYQEPFTPTISGTDNVGSFTSESGTYTIVGKGTPPALGTRGGSTRTVIYSYLIDTAAFSQPEYLPPTSSNLEFMYLYLNGSTVVGADFYGQKAAFPRRWTTQINARWQKKVGI